MDQLQFVAFSFIQKRAVYVGSGEGQDLLDELTLTFDSITQLHSQNFGIEPGGCFQVFDHESCVIEGFQHRITS
jgi:hypothetical protein